MLRISCLTEEPRRTRMPLLWLEESHLLLLGDDWVAVVAVPADDTDERAVRYGPQHIRSLQRGQRR